MIVALLAGLLIAATVLVAVGVALGISESGGRAGTASTVGIEADPNGNQRVLAALDWLAGSAVA